MIIFLYESPKILENTVICGGYLRVEKKYTFLYRSVSGIMRILRATKFAQKRTASEKFPSGPR